MESDQGSNRVAETTAAPAQPAAETTAAPAQELVRDPLPEQPRIAGIGPGRIVMYRVGENEQPLLRSNGIQPGDVLPAIVMRDWGTPEGLVNLRIFCDGAQDAWATSVRFGDQPGQWSWPTRQ